MMSGRQFIIVDDWPLPSAAHRRLRNSWTGTTTFCMQIDKKVAGGLAGEEQGDEGLRRDGSDVGEISDVVTFEDLCKLVRLNFPEQAREVPADVPELNPGVSQDVGA